MPSPDPATPKAATTLMQGQGQVEVEGAMEFEWSKWLTPTLMRLMSLFCHTVHTVYCTGYIQWTCCGTINPLYRETLIVEKEIRRRCIRLESLVGYVSPVSTQVELEAFDRSPLWVLLAILCPP
jgi:hypothetical protein